MTVQVGQCGIQLGNAFWKTLGKEHKVGLKGKHQGKPNDSDNQLDKIEVFYQDVGFRRFVPRTCLIDLDPGTMNIVKASPMAALFNPDNMCFGASGAGNCWYGLRFTLCTLSDDP